MLYDVWYHLPFHLQRLPDSNAVWRDDGVQTLDRADLKISASVAHEQGAISSPVVVHSDGASVDVIHSAIRKGRESDGASREAVHDAPFS